MGLFSFFKKTDINAEVELCRNTPGAVLIDVRTKEEYAAGHIPGSINIPADKILGTLSLINDLTVPVYVYCLRGTRSMRAAAQLRAMGYTNIKSIGGIVSYRGTLEK